MTAVVEQLKHEGVSVQDNDLAHIWPTRYAHINMYSKYHFNIEEVTAAKGYVHFGYQGAGTSAQNFSVSRKSLY